MLYYSTRDCERKNGITSAEAILRGIAPDGGLYMPESIPQVDAGFIDRLSRLDYAGRATEILSLFLTDYPKEDIESCAGAAYSEDRFPGGAAPLKKLDDKLFSLELWHGPTCAFKDIALQIMPRLLSKALGISRAEKDLLILVATSGDTGKAALEGYRDADRIKIIVFYPSEGVSRVQKLQMITQKGENTKVCGIRGNFDDAQNGVKALFADKEFEKDLASVGYAASSANSINWGRLVPQIVYYFSAYCDVLSTGEIKIGDEIDFCVPTGNFGDIFAAYLAKRMGLPVGRLVCASNRNNILTDFLRTGVYDRNRPFYTTSSPSMDILISSNLERLIYAVAGPEQTAGYMKLLAEKGRYEVSDEILSRIRGVFTGYYAGEDDTAEAINAFWNNYGYLCDTHTAVAMSCARRYAASERAGRPLVTVSTASAYKFPSSVLRALGVSEAPDGTDALQMLSEFTKTDIPLPLRGLDSAAVRFPGVCDPGKMGGECLSFAGKG